MDVDELPREPRGRFDLLFAEKPAWLLLEDFQPYLKGMEVKAPPRPE